MRLFRTAAMMILAALPAFAGEIEVDVKGMTCISCAQALNAAFQDHKEVDHVTIDVEAGKMVIHTVQGQTLSEATIRTVIDKAGYEATAVKTTKD